MTRRRHRMPTIPVMVGLAFGPLAFSSAPTSAQTAEGRFSVRATVEATCRVSMPSSFVTPSPFAPASAAAANVSCTNGGRWTQSVERRAATATGGSLTIVTISY